MCAERLGISIILLGLSVASSISEDVSCVQELMPDGILYIKPLTGVDVGGSIVLNSNALILFDSLLPLTMAELGEPGRSFVSSCLLLAPYMHVDCGVWTNTTQCRSACTFTNPTREHPSSSPSRTPLRLPSTSGNAGKCLDLPRSNLTLRNI